MMMMMMMMMMMVIMGCSSGFAQKTFIPYAETFGESFVQGRVVLVEPEGRRVVLEDGQVGGVEEEALTGGGKDGLIDWRSE